jgi:hypothetical protein
MGGCLSPGLGSTQLTGGPENSVIITRFFQQQSKPAKLDTQLTQDSKSMQYAGQVTHLKPMAPDNIHAKGSNEHTTH